MDLSPGPTEAIWQPSPERVERARLTRFTAWLAAERGLRFDTYQQLWQWSVDDLDGFWRAIWDFFEVRADGDPEPVLGSRRMPGAEWFPKARLSYPEHVFAGKEDAATAIVHASELRPLTELSWGELRVQVAAAAAALRALGVGEGDRVVAYLPNVPEAVVAFLASASLGAIWSSSSPDFGAASVVDRFAQIEPKVMFAVDGYRYGGKDFDRRETVAALRQALPSLERTVLLPYLDPAGGAGAPAGTTTWGSFLGSGAGAELEFARVPFDHPLWILYSSGTTGLPKAIVQGHGGILIEHLKQLDLHLDAQPGDRLFWFTTTGWMMWNFLVSGLLTEAAIVLYDGNPGHPDMETLWELAERAGVTTFGTSAAFLGACAKAGVRPRAGRELAALRAVGSTGSPLSPEGFDWVYEQLGPDLLLFSTSGGTDLCTALVGGATVLPVYRGEIQARSLAAAVEAWDEEGKPLVGAVGELVVTEPIPSMPICFWNDADGSRYREAYFEMFPGAWRHGDWIEFTERGGAIIHGRSDSTINRGGIRMGTAEIYRAVLTIEAVTDALAVDLPRPGTEGWLPLFLVLRDGVELDDGLRAEVARLVRERCSPRHVPDRIYQVAEIPRTLSGKILEVPVKRILMGTPVEAAASRGSLANPAALDWFVDLAEQLQTEAADGAS
ncbi:MAG: acetoacetate--CoA ligase [Actinobacteria bacterium]|nr:acetoacetate--CoA ligase [Actinomycetota bacterium]